MAGMDVVRAKLAHAFRSGQYSKPKMLPLFPNINSLDERTCREKTFADCSNTLTMNRSSYRIRNTKSEQRNSWLDNVRKCNQVLPDLFGRSVNSKRGSHAGALRF